MGKHLSVLFPRWQGGGIKATYEGAASLERTYLAGREYMTVPVEMDNDMAVVRYAEVNDGPLVVVRALDKEGSRNVYVHVDMARRMKVTLAGNQVQKDVTDWRRARPVL